MRRLNLATTLLSKDKQAAETYLKEHKCLDEFFDWYINRGPGGRPVVVEQAFLDVVVEAWWRNRRNMILQHRRNQKHRRWFLKFVAATWHNGIKGVEAERANADTIARQSDKDIRDVVALGVLKEKAYEEVIAALHEEIQAATNQIGMNERLIEAMEVNYQATMDLVETHEQRNQMYEGADAERALYEMTIMNRANTDWTRVIDLRADS